MFSINEKPIGNLVNQFQRKFRSSPIRNLRTQFPTSMSQFPPRNVFKFKLEFKFNSHFPFR